MIAWREPRESETSLRRNGKELKGTLTQFRLVQSCVELEKKPRKITPRNRQGWWSSRPYLVRASGEKGKKKVPAIEKGHR